MGLVCNLQLIEDIANYINERHDRAELDYAKTEPLKLPIPKAVTGKSAAAAGELGVSTMALGFQGRAKGAEGGGWYGGGSRGSMAVAYAKNYWNINSAISTVYTCQRQLCKRGCDRKHTEFGNWLNHVEKNC